MTHPKRKMRLKRSAKAVLVVAALALAIPAAASAAKLETPAKPLLPVGSSITGTSTNMGTEIAGQGYYYCEEVVVTEKVTRNDGSIFAFNGSGKASGCYREFGGIKHPLIRRNWTLQGESIKPEGGLGQVAIQMSFVEEEPETGLVCTWKTPAGAKASYVIGGESLNLKSVGLQGACGASAINESFLFRNGSEPVIFR